MCKWTRQGLRGWLSREKFLRTRDALPDEPLFNRARDNGDRADFTRDDVAATFSGEYLFWPR